MEYSFHHPSPLGGVTLAATEKALTGLWFDGQKYFAAGLDPAAETRPLPIFDEAARWLDAYFAGREPGFTPPLAPRGTDFQQAVWSLLLKIPYGETTTYGALATELAAKTLSEIPPADCRDALAWLKAHPVSGRGELSGTTMNKLALALGSILKQARDDGLIVRSPMESVKLPKVDTREKDAMTPAELTAFLDAVDGLPIDGRTVALYLMATMGLRRGEALALLDSDVSGGYANVHLSVKEADGSVSVPKSPASVRTVPIPRRTMERISLWREVRKAAGFGDAERLCCNTEGGLLLPQNLWKWWAKVRGSLGCEGMGLHQLRHSNLSMMARHMSPFDLQRYAGWSSIEPARVYIHADLDSVTRAVSDAWA